MVLLQMTLLNDGRVIRFVAQLVLLVIPQLSDNVKVLLVVEREGPSTELGPTLENSGY